MKVASGIEFDVYAHLLAGLPGGWGDLRARFPDISDRTFWRKVRAAKELMARNLEAEDVRDSSCVAAVKRSSDRALMQMMAGEFSLDVSPPASER